VTERTATVGQAGGTGAAAEFERLYRANVEAVTAYFARRSADPHVVADLTADTFVTAITSFGSFDPGRGTARAWVFGIARRIGEGPSDHHGDIPFAQRDDHRERARHPGRGHPRDRRGDQRAHLVRGRNPGLAPGAELRGHAPAASRERRLRVDRRLRVISE
jgi:hypothetical protein